MVAERTAVSNTLKSLIRKSKLKNPKYSVEEERIAKVLSDVPGPRRVAYLHALSGVRTQMGQRDFYKNGLINSARYLSRMEEIFARYDLPIELTRLPLVESSFNEKAISKVGASGIWQFMPGIGKRFLYVDASIDERNSPLKATDAAAHLFLQNFRIFKAWPLAVTAYNHGAGGMLHAIHQLKTEDLSTIIERYRNRSFQFASSNFFASYLAALHAERYQTEIFGPLQKAEPLLSDTVQLASRSKASKLVQVAGITMEELRLYNPDLKIKGKNGNFLLHRGYALHVPAGRGARIELMNFEGQDLSDKRGAKKHRGSLHAETARHAPVTAEQN